MEKRNVIYLSAIFILGIAACGGESPISNQPSRSDAGSETLSVIPVILTGWPEGVSVEGKGVIPRIAPSILRTVIVGFSAIPDPLWKGLNKINKKLDERASNMLSIPERYPITSISEDGS